MEENLFKIRDLNLWYQNQKKHVIRGINMDIKPGVTALIGPSGCGKSSFLRNLNQMNYLIDGTTLEGSIIFDNKYELVNNETWRNIFKKKDLNHIDTMELRTKVGMVFQKANPFDMSVYDNVAYGPRSSGIKDRRILDQIVEESLKDAALWEQVSDDLLQPSLGLSGGQQQRLCIARAIAMKPDVILMDEPTSSLDPGSTKKIEKLIKRLKSKYSIIIVTHSMIQAKRISDMTAFFHKGKLVEYRNTKELFKEPEHDITLDYIKGKIY